MFIRSLLAGAALLAVGASESRASGIVRSINPECTSGSLVTCASVRVKFDRAASAANAVLSVGGVSTTLARPQILASWMASDGRFEECRPGGRDCRVVEDPATITPEPVTMTLLATGLLGLGGVSGVRRRLNARRKETQLN